MLNDYLQFHKSENIIFNKDSIESIDFRGIQNLNINVTLKTGKIINVNGIYALELAMQLKPSILEGKRLKWPKYMWAIHNIVGHPLMQLFAFFRLYKLAFWIHEATIPKPIGRK